MFVYGEGESLIIIVSPSIRDWLRSSWAGSLGLDMLECLVWKVFLDLMKLWEGRSSLIIFYSLYLL